MKQVCMRKGLAGCVLVLAFATAVQAAYVEMADGTRREGTDIRAKSDGSIILTTAQGQMTLLKGQYARAVADKPADFDRARKFASEKNYDEALKLLDPIIQGYRFLEWDSNARALRAQIQIAKGDAVGAVETYDLLFRNAPDFRKKSEILWAYFGVLVTAKQFDKLAPQLDELIKKGTRPDAAKAQNMRGDLKLAQGKVEGALLDYLRTATLFGSEKESAAEGLFKAADTLEKQRDPRAKELYSKLQADYAGTLYATKAVGK